MSLSDSIADMCTRVRNAQMAHHEEVDVPYSRIKAELLTILKREGYIVDFVVEGDVKKTIRVYLKYGRDRRPAIRGLRRESRPGVRRYVSVDAIPHVLGGLGIAILSSSKGLMTDREAREAHVGGELVCKVW